MGAIVFFVAQFREGSGVISTFPDEETRIQNKQDQVFLALRRWSLELNKYCFNLDALGLQASTIKLIQLSEIAIGQKQELYFLQEQ